MGGQNWQNSKKVIKKWSKSKNSKMQKHKK